MSPKLYDIDTLLDEVVTLPSLPSAVMRLTELIDSPECPLPEVAHVLSSDPSLAMKTLRLINSAYYGLSNKVSTLEHAVVLLGARVIKNLTLTATVFDSMSDSASDFLYHCVATGVAMGVLSKAGPVSRFIASSDEAFLYGLLHDIGRIVMVEAMPEEYARVVALARAENKPLWQAEREVIGVDHAELGGRLAQRWRLNAAMVEAIAGHHDIAKTTGEYGCIGAMLSLADFVAWESGLPSYEGAAVVLDPKMFDSAGVAVSQIPAAMERYFDSFDTIQDFVQLLA